MRATHRSSAYTNATCVPLVAGWCSSRVSRTLTSADGRTLTTGDEDSSKENALEHGANWNGSAGRLVLSAAHRRTSADRDVAGAVRPSPVEKADDQAVRSASRVRSLSDSVTLTCLRSPSRKQSMTCSGRFVGSAGMDPDRGRALTRVPSSSFDRIVSIAMSCRRNVRFTAGAAGRRPMSCVARRRLAGNQRRRAERRPPQLQRLLDGISQRQQAGSANGRPSKSMPTGTPSSLNPAGTPSAGQPGMGADLALRSALRIADPRRLTAQRRIHERGELMLARARPRSHVCRAPPFDPRAARLLALARLDGVARRKVASSAV